MSNKVDRDEALSGYSEKLYPNEDWESQDGVLCQWEHCIEWMPSPSADEDRAFVLFKCPLFGHLCPGGMLQVSECADKYDDIMQNAYRIVKQDPNFSLNKKGH